MVVADVRRLWRSDLADEAWVVEFLEAVGSDPAEFPPDFLATAVELVPVFRRGRPFHEADLPIAELAAAPFPKLVVSGGHHPGFEAMSDDLAARIGASREVIAGAGHEIQFTGGPLNDTLRALWSAARRPPSPDIGTPARSTWSPSTRTSRSGVSVER